MHSDDPEKSSTHMKEPEVEAQVLPGNEGIDGLSSEEHTHVDELVTHHVIVR